MKINEILTEDIEQLDEINWKKAAAAATLAGASLFGADRADAQSASVDNITQQSQQAESPVITNFDSLNRLAYDLGGVSAYVEYSDNLSKSIYTYDEHIRFYDQVKKILVNSIKKMSPQDADKIKQSYKNGQSAELKSLANLRDPKSRHLFTQLERNFNIIKNNPDLWSNSTVKKQSSNPSTQTQTSSSVSEEEIVDQLRGYIEYNRESGPITQELVDELGAQGLMNMNKAYSNFLKEFSEIKNPKNKQQYESLLKELRKDIKSYEQYIQNMYVPKKTISRSQDELRKAAHEKALRDAFRNDSLNKQK